MARTRAGLLDGALTVIERDGLHRVTMSAVANRSGVAKATLYNHFRTKDDVLAALLLREVELLADQAQATASRAAAAGTDQDDATAAGLATAAGAAAEHVAGRRVAGEDPAALRALLVQDEGPGWTLAVRRLSALLRLPSGHVVVRLVAGWLAGQLFDPQELEQRAATATVLAQLAAQARRDALPGVDPGPRPPQGVDDPPAPAQPGPGPG
jgi:AcrR family transcriptional regulator